jgi:thiamine-phosphate pyrophosphorylase
MTRSDIDAFFASLPVNAIYGLCDQALLDQYHLSIEAYVSLCKREGVSLIQYRTKEQDLTRVSERLDRLRALWDGVLIVNDHWQFYAQCDGVHLGQDDLEAIDSDMHRAAQALRDRLGVDAIIGLSTHNADEIAQADELPIDYIGLGAFRATGTKRDAAVLGADLDTLAQSSRHPVAAIGGVGFEDRFTHARMRVMGSALMCRA